MGAPEAPAALRRLPFYAALDPRQRGLLVEGGRLLLLQPRQRAFREGEPCQRSLLVLDGVLRVQKVS
ncbi:MAG: Crp/Fnr family transcriptional regulator, partial [Gammaproteobacteria bacterium]